MSNSYKIENKNNKINTFKNNGLKNIIKEKLFLKSTLRYTKCVYQDN